MTNFSDLKEDGVDLITFNPQVGDIWYVDSGSLTGADSAGYGTAPATPFLTLDYAIGAATADNGDIIYLAPGHAETHGTGSLFAIDVAGLTIIGLGKGAARASFTLTHTGGVCTISAASTWLENVLFVAGIDSIVAPLTISAADCTLKDVEFRDTTDVEFVAGVITTAAADRLTIDGLFYNGYTGGNACTLGIKLIGVNTATIKNCRFHGLFSTAAIQMVTTLCTNVVIEDCYFLNTGTAVTKDVVMGVAACTYQVVNCFDGVAGYAIAGSNATPVQWAGTRPLVASKLSGTLTNATAALWNFMGLIRIHTLCGHVETAFANTTCNVKFSVQGSADTAALDIAANKDFDNLVDDTAFTITNDFSQAVLATTDVGAIEVVPTAGQMPAFPAYSPAITGAINVVGSAINAGKLQCYLVWEPVSPGAYVLAA